MLQRIVRSSALLLASGVLMLHLTSAAAQYQGEGPARPEKRTDAEAKAAADRAKRKSIEEFEDAEESLAPTAGAPECVWTGRRIVSLLWRDDIDTARRYMALYDQFTCSPKHLKLAFHCVIEQGPLGGLYGVVMIWLWCSRSRLARLDVFLRERKPPHVPIGQPVLNLLAL